jgi:hypothetical protein
MTVVKSVLVGYLNHANREHRQAEKKSREEDHVRASKQKKRTKIPIRRKRAPKPPKCAAILFPHGDIGRAGSSPGLLAQWSSSSGVG